MLYPFDYEHVLVRKPPTLFGNMLQVGAARPLIRRTPIALAVAFAATLAANAVGSAAQAQSLSDLVGSAKKAGSALFGSTEFASGSMDALPQWRRILGDLRNQTRDLRDCIRSANACADRSQRDLGKLIRDSRGKSRMKKLQAVNRFFNRWPYKLDEDAYGLREYWANPSEFMRRSGDCEDYAIAKFFALRQLGFDNDSMRIVVLWDRIRNIGHAVLAVYDGPGILILDNINRMIVSHASYRHYIPQYSMNETTRWAHVHKQKIPRLVASTS